MNKTIQFFDTTLRDGLQTRRFPDERKIELARLIDQTGVSIIEAGFADSELTDLPVIKAAAENIKNSIVCGLALPRKEHIEEVAKALGKNSQYRIHTFMSVGIIDMQTYNSASPENTLHAIKESVSFARNLSDDVEWSALDATRSEPEFLKRAVEAAISGGATVVSIPDTTGHSLPLEYGRLIETLMNSVEGIEKIHLSVHCHDDMRLANANSIAAIEAGASQVEVTLNGVGIRKGNASLEQLALISDERKDVLPAIEKKLNMNKVYEATEFMNNILKLVSGK